jgi:hypothetical protein
VTIPFTWPGKLDLEKGYPEIAAAFQRDSWSCLAGSFVLEHNGKPCDAPPFVTQDKKSMELQLIFGGLPAGQYTLKMCSTDDLIAMVPSRRESSGPYPGWKRAELSFAITSKTPPEFRAKTLRVEMTD